MEIIDAQNVAGISVEELELLSYLLDDEVISEPQDQVIAHDAHDEDPVCSFAQERLWFLDQLQPGNPVYNSSAVLELDGALDVAALEQSLLAVIARHAPLHTAFLAGPHGPVPQRVPVPDSILVHLDLRDIPTADRQAHYAQLARAEAQRPFDLATAPLLRATLLAFSPQQHVLLLTLHHIITDGWSITRLLHELSICYPAFLRGDSAEALLPPLTLHYTDYARWQRTPHHAQHLAPQLDYWRRQLADAPPVLALPLDRPRPSVQRFRGAFVPCQLSPALTSALQQLSQRTGGTLFMTLQAAFAALLARYTRQHDILVGTPVAGRTQQALEPLIGLFVNTLVLRTDLRANPSFHALLTQVRATLLDAYAHQEVPFEQVVEALQPTRDLSHTPLFQVMFVLQNTPPPHLEFPDLTISPVELDPGIAKFDLTLSLTPRDDSLQGIIEYNTDLFDEATIRRMADHYQNLLEAIVAHPDLPVMSLPLLTDAERRAILDSAATTHPLDSRAGCIHQRVEAWAAATPDAIALSYEDQQLSYAALNARANQLAHHLVAQGVKAETLVGLCVERSLDMVVGILGILKAGGAYVPLDPSYPPDRLAFMIADSQAPVVVTQAQLGSVLPTEQTRVVMIDDHAAQIGMMPTNNPALDVRPEQPAYVIYTSGSTGQPKGVLVQHANVLALLDSTHPSFGFDQRDVWTLFHSYAFDFSVWELWGALTYGGRLVVVPFLVSRSPQAFLQLLRDEQVTVLNQTPSAFRQLLHADAQSSDTDDLALRYVIFGGEALDPQSLEPWFARHGDQRPQLVNMYGITETTVHVTYRPITLADTQPGAPSVIGQPIPNWELYVLDEYRQLVPLGVPGELYVGGAGVARGYLNRPALMAERFIENPFRQGGRLYRSGDLARRLPNGDLEYLGRIDQQVKIRGFRIELGEIETALLQHPSVRECVVLAREDTPGDTRLVAYIVSRTDQRMHMSELRAHLQTQLPSYMLPAAFVELQALPLTANGKLDRRALPDADTSRSELSEAYVAPRTPVEEVLASIWSRVLGIAQVGVNDNFFALGGDSIRSIQVIAQAQEHGIHITLQQVFQHQLISQLAQHVADQQTSAPLSQQTSSFSLISEHDHALLPAGIVDAYPLTSLQTGMLYHMLSQPDDPVYHNVDSYHLRGHLDSACFQESLRQIIARHPVLRTSIDLSSYSVPLQLVHAEPTLAYLEHDIRHLDPADQERAVQAFVELETQRRFDLAQTPLLRFAIHRRSDTTFQMTITEFHPMLDGWSLHTIIAEVFGHHFALLREERPELPQLTNSFRTFVQLEQQALQAEDSQRYWAQQLADANRIKLPRSSAAGSSTATRRGMTEIVLITQMEQLQATAQTLGVPLKSLFLASHLRVMSLLGGTKDVLTGVVSNGRQEEGDGDRVCGLFLNTLPFRLNLQGGTWRELIQQTFSSEVAMLPHRRYPLGELQRQWGGGEPLFEMAFNYLNFHVVDDLFKSHNLEHIGMPTLIEETNFTLQAHFMSRPSLNDFVLKLDYDSTELSEQQVQAIGGYYLATLDALVRDIDERYDQLSLLATEERSRILTNWNATQRSYPDGATIQELFTAQVARTPDAPAVVFGEQQLTYRELDSRANRLAHYLRAHGIGPDMLVGVYIERSLELLVGLLGILKAGGAYVPLDPDYPVERLSYMLEDAQVSLVLTQQHVQANLPQLDVAMLCLDADWQTIAAYAEDTPTNNVSPTNLAYMIYTSGSTGRPKGAMNTHEAIRNRLLWMQETYDLTGADRVLQKTPCSFDVSVWEFFWPLITGACLIVSAPGGHRDSKYLVNLIVEQQVTTLHFVPSMLQMFLSEPDVERCISLRQIMCSGEALSYDLQARCHERLSARLHNLYGPTEAAVDVTFWECQRGSAEHTVPIGYPVANTQMYVLDTQLQPVPVGVSGQLYIGGIQLARGYHQRPALTGEKFIPDPFAQAAGGRLYCTGDLARYRTDGAIEFLGRIDHQVKLRGFRIELGEIEAAVAQHEAVRECVILLREDTPGDKALVAYVVLHADHDLSVAQLRQFLKERLPDYMVPSATVFLATLPLTPNGKLDRRALPAPAWSRSAQDAAFVAPRTAVEETLAEVWAEVLGKSDIGVHDDFFELGGHSLTAMRLMVRLGTAFQIDLPLRTLFDAPTIASLAVQVERATQGERVSMPPLVPMPREQHPPLSFAQQRLWFLDQLVPESPLYSIPTAIRMKGRLDEPALRQSLTALVQRHETLRTSFVMVNDRPVQLIMPELVPDIALVDLRALDTLTRDEEVMRVAADEAQQPFDLQRGPLVRFTLVRLTDDEHALLLTMHHIISDGWSLSVLTNDLVALYAAAVEERPANLPALPVQYADYAILQQDWLRDEVLTEQISYWKQQLAGAPALLSLPLDHPRPAVQGTRGAAQQFALGRELTVALNGLSQQEHVTLFMTLLAAWQVLLYRYSGQTDLLVGTPTAGRTHRELEGLIGLFVNTLVLRTDLRGDPDFRALLARVRDVTLDAYMHQELPFEAIVEELQPTRDLSYAPLVQMLFVLQNTPQLQTSYGDLEFQMVERPNGTTKYDLTVVLYETAEGLIGAIEYNCDLFEPSTIDALIAHYQQLLSAIVTVPDQSISTIPFLTDRERLLIQQWSAGPEEPLPTQCVHQLFEEQVARTPHTIAVTWKQQHLTYAELNARANQLAHHLRALGIGPDTLVGVSLDRSIDLMVALLGILKAGGAYVPLDLSYPSARLAFMLADSQAPVLITAQSLLDRVPSHTAQVVCMDADAAQLAQQSTANPHNWTTTEHLAFVCYTSGSTGQPKGVRVPHRGVLRLVMQPTYATFSADDVFLQFAPIGFDPSLVELWGSLLHGARLVVAPAEIPTLDELGQLLEREQITMLWLTAGMFHQMVDYQLASLCGVRQIIAGGDIVSLAHTQKLLAARTHGVVVNGYGPTENTTFTTCYPMTDVSQLHSTVPIGRPLAHTQVYILDPQMRPVHIGGSGELYTGGEGLGRDYLNRPALTADKFVPDPFSGRAGARLYKTGDLVRYLADGNIEFLGRIDQQIKLRGFRIELGEIEAALKEHPAIQDVVVLAPEVAPGDRRLVAYIVPTAQEPEDQTQDASALSDALRASLREQLPEYMLPAAFVLLESLPLTTNGKVDQRALSQIKAVFVEQVAEFVPPSTPVETQLAEIWQEVLGLSKIGVHDNFFAVGGHSLLATQIIARIRTSFMVELPLRTIFEAPTVAELAVRIMAACGPEEAVSAWDVSSTDREEGEL